MKIKVLRSDPASGGVPEFREYEVPYTEEQGYTVMDALDYIFNNLDATLSYFSHSACNHGICGRCAVKTNGKVKLACLALLEGEEVTLEPKNSNVLKDLITR